jgi:hypothetical protein
MAMMRIVENKNETVAKKQVKFCEVVAIIHIPRLSQEEG